MKNRGGRVLDFEGEYVLHRIEEILRESESSYRLTILLLLEIVKGDKDGLKSAMNLARMGKRDK